MSIAKQFDARATRAIEDVICWMYHWTKDFVKDSISKRISKADKRLRDTELNRDF